MPTIIPIDGPASAGKNSVGQALANKLKYHFVDSGWIFRAGAKQVLEQGVDITNESAVADVYKNLDLTFKVVDDKTRVILNGQDVTDHLHDPQISILTSAIAAFPKVRVQSTKLQKQIGENQDTVMTGRDIGTEIFPDSKVKFFLTARPEIRALRRFEQLKKNDPELTFVKVYSEMMQRDEQDANRETSPMRIPEGAILIDNSQLTVDQTVEAMLQHLA